MRVYVYCIKEDYPYKSSITGQSFENEWFKLSTDGTILVKGTNKRGYSWDGCSPKYKFWDMYFGTPEAVINYETRYSRTYYASLIHDLFYQFSKDVKGIVKRGEVDREFYAILKRDGFRIAGWYYGAVRLFGWIWWGKPGFIKKLFGRP
jgi:hypothetical protein